MASIERPVGAFVTVKGKWAAAFGLLLVFAGAETPVRATGSGHTSVGADSATYSQVSAEGGTSGPVAVNIGIRFRAENVGVAGKRPEQPPPGRYCRQDQKATIVASGPLDYLRLLCRRHAAHESARVASPILRSNCCRPMPSMPQAARNEHTIST
jgi:hypothetical protein